MSTAKWENLLLPRLAGAPQVMVQAELVRVIDDFCMRSCVWREAMYGMDVIDNQQVNTMNTQIANAVAVGVLDVHINKRRLNQVSQVFVGKTTTCPRAFTVMPTRPVTFIFDANPTELILSALDVETYLAPVDVTEDLPSILTDKFFEAIFDGVMSAMCASPDKPYTDSALAGFHGSRYLSSLNSARVQAKMGFTSQAQNWQFPRFGC